MAKVEQRAAIVTWQHLVGLVAILVTLSSVIRFANGGDADWLATGIIDAFCLAAILWLRAQANRAAH